MATATKTKNGNGKPDAASAEVAPGTSPVEIQPEITPPAKDANLWQRMLWVMENLDYVQRETKRVNGQYTFASHDRVTAEVRKWLVKAGIVTRIEIIDESYMQFDVMQNGVQGLVGCTKVKAGVWFINAANPTERERHEGLGYGLDQWDKGPGKATSYAVKTALLKGCMLETGDDPDNTVNPMGAGMTRQTQQPAQQQQSQTPPQTSPAGANTLDELERKRFSRSLTDAMKAYSISPDEAREICGGKGVKEMTLDELKAASEKMWAEGAKRKQGQQTAQQQDAAAEQSQDGPTPEQRIAALPLPSKGGEDLATNYKQVAAYKDALGWEDAMLAECMENEFGTPDMNKLNGQQVHQLAVLLEQNYDYEMSNKR